MRHERTHTEAFICVLCGKATWTSNALVEHCEADHKEKSKHICKVCGFYNFTEALLRQHTLQVHMKGTKEYRCQHCDFKTSVQSTFAAHVRNHQKQFCICEHCGKECSTQQALTSHRRCHEVIKFSLWQSANLIVLKPGACQLIPVPVLPKTVCSRLPSKDSQADAHEGEAFPVYRVRSMLWLAKLIDKAHTESPHPRGRHAV